MFTSNGLDKYFGELSEQMWTLLPIDPDFALTLLEAAKGGAGYRQAGLGSSAVRQSLIRSDSIRWIESDHGPAEARLLQKLAELRQNLQEYFRLHLEKVECHFSIYQPSEFYARHRDTGIHTTDGTTRIFSFVIYLNPEWQPGDGGELCGYAGGKTIFKIPPVLGTMILFRSDLEHEVLPAGRTRYALSGWLRK